MCKLMHRNNSFFSDSRSLIQEKHYPDILKFEQTDTNIHMQLNENTAEGIAGPDSCPIKVSSVEESSDLVVRKAPKGLS